ncbi:MAG: hypothetical protein KGK07_15225 [Chloroflexota bacterium]|nr:hypothetical protein [Chloroflexota bacterium]
MADALIQFTAGLRPLCLKETHMKPTVGRIVHYVLPEHVSKRCAGMVRPAIVVRVWGDGISDKPAAPVADPDHGSVQLQVFTDCSNDGDACAAGVMWATSVHYDESGAPGTWHWPPRA